MVDGALPLASIYATVGAEAAVISEGDRSSAQALGFSIEVVE
jgi:hypothetical protein